MDWQKRDEIIRQILSDQTEIRFVEDVMSEFESKTGEQVRSFWPVNFVGKSMGRSLERKPLAEVDDPVTLRELADNIVTIAGSPKAAKEIVQLVVEANSQNQRFPATVSEEASFTPSDLAKMEAQELVDRAGSQAEVEKIIDRLP